MAKVVYIITSLIALSCGGMLLRGYRRSGRRLLLWSSLCFFFLGGENVFLFVDLVIVPGIDLRPLRGGLSLIGMIALVYGLVWEKD